MNKRDCFCFPLLVSFFMESFTQWFTLVLDSFFEQGYLLNLIILRVYGKRWPKYVHIFQNRNIWRYGLNFWKKRKFGKQNLMKERKQPSVVIAQQAFFYNVFILLVWLWIVWSFNQDVYFMNFYSQIFFNSINHGYRAALCGCLRS